MPRDRSLPPLPAALPLPVTDNHTHIEPGHGLGDAALGLAEQVERAQAVGVHRIVQCGCDLPSARWTAGVAVRHPAVVGAIALHPNDAARALAGEPDEDAAGESDGQADAASPVSHGDGREGETSYEAMLAEIAELARGNDRIRAIGETGLDYYRTGESGRPLQRRAFADHIALAKELNLALQIHDREAHEDVLAVLHAQGAPERTVFHCFSGDAAMARVVAEAGWYVSVAGTVTFANAAALREAVAATPLSRLLVETDAPYLTPQPYRGRTNAPYLVPLTVRAIAEVKGLAVEDVCEALERNTTAVYGQW